MLHSEPVIERCLDVIVSNTLAKGISCMSHDGKTYATPAFQNFVDIYYRKFGCEAIRMFFLLGFVVWRIRRMDVDGIVQSIPEVLPLGTFTWSVETPDEKKETSKRKRVDTPLLYYKVRLTGVETDFRVFEYIKPDFTMQCISPLSSVIPLYIRTQISRTCKMRCDEWNASARIAVEHNEKMLNNQLAEDGTCLNSMENSHFDSMMVRVPFPSWCLPFFSSLTVMYGGDSKTTSET